MAGKIIFIIFKSLVIIKENLNYISFNNIIKTLKEKTVKFREHSKVTFP